MEGVLIMGLGYVLIEEVWFSGGDIFDCNFDCYCILCFSDLLCIEVVFVCNEVFVF